MTTVQEIETLLNDYRAWLRDKTTLREVNGSWVRRTLGLYAETDLPDRTLQTALVLE
jgi:hypothetical protein